MNYEFDPKKSENGKFKHGIASVEVQALWNDIDFWGSQRKQLTKRDCGQLQKATKNIGPGLLHIAVIIYGLFQLGVPGMRSLSFMQAKDLDKKLDEGKNILKHFDLSKAKRPNQEQKRVNVDFPLWMIQSLDKELNFRFS